MATARRFAAVLAERSQGFGEGIAELGIDLRVCTVVVDAAGAPTWVTSTDETILVVGGRWDRAARAWVEGTEQEPPKIAIVRVTRGGAQERAARWLAAWFEAHVSGDWASFIARFGHKRRPWSLLLMGGRRSGKSHIACVALVIYALLYPASIVWAISPTQGETAELERAIKTMLPSAWYRYRGAGAGKVSTFTLPHGGQVLLISGYKPSGLRRGRVDFVLFNEAQNMSQAGYTQLRPAIADTKGLVMLAANPPNRPIGRWVDEHQEGIVAGKIAGAHFDFDPKENPFADYEALETMAAEVDAHTFDRDILGISRPIGDVVFHAWNNRESIRDVPDHLVDVTAELTKRELGVAREWVVGMDFQNTPMVGAVIKFFRDPADPTRDVLTWVVGEAVVENATEDDLVDALAIADRWTPAGYKAAGGFSSSECAVVMDASGFWQDGDHSAAKEKRTGPGQRHGQTSELKLRARGWNLLFRPSSDVKSNPRRYPRIQSGNARLQTKDGKRHMFVTPECGDIANAMKRWENRNGVANPRSDFAHAGDAVTYVIYRFFALPPAPPKKPPTYDRVRTSTRADDVAGL